MMNTDYGFSNNFLNKYDFGGYSEGRFNYASARYVKSENADITIITDDGDRITISSDTSMESSYSSYSGLLRSGSSSVRTEGYEYQSQMRSNFSMSIAGDLDMEEYDDIITALKTIDSVMKSVSSGNMADLRSIAEKFGGLESLSGLTASIQVEESMSYKQAQSAVSEVNEQESRDNKGLGHADKLDHALDRILHSAKKRGTGFGRVKRLMNNYLSEMLDLFSKKSEKNKHNREAGELMKNMIMNRLVEKSREEEGIAENTPAESSIM
ncbi:MAG: hypothetical protein PVG39_20300 [Desulfobacteraceae bacterium]